VGFAGYNQIWLPGLLLVFENKPDNEATQRCQKTINRRIFSLPFSREIRKKVLDEIAVVAIH
jgi:hypothetical protein